MFYLIYAEGTSKAEMPAFVFCAAREPTKLVSQAFGNLNELFKETILLNTSFSGVESLLSTQ